MVLEAAVVCDSRTAWEFVTFCEERINLELIRFCTHELPLFLSMALLVVFIVCQGFEQMPRRMLRHRVIQQCARLALGVSENEIILNVV